MSSEGNLDGAMNLGEILHDKQMPLGGREPYPEGSRTALITEASGKFLRPCTALEILTRVPTPSIVSSFFRIYNQDSFLMIRPLSSGKFFKYSFYTVLFKHENLKLSLLSPSCLYKV